jgi:hypothetical protein
MRFAYLAVLRVFGSLAFNPLPGKLGADHWFPPR